MSIRNRACIYTSNRSYLLPSATVAHQHNAKTSQQARHEVSKQLKGSVVPMSKSQFTRVPKITELITAGVPLRAVPTYLALADHAHNKTGETFVSVVRVSEVLRVCRRTVERHLGALEAAGVIKRQRQRRGRGG